MQTLRTYSPLDEVWSRGQADLSAISHYRPFTLVPPEPKYSTTLCPLSGRLQTSCQTEVKESSSGDVNVSERTPVDSLQAREGSTRDDDLRSFEGRALQELDEGLNNKVLFVFDRLARKL